MLVTDEKESVLYIVSIKFINIMNSSLALNKKMVNRKFVIQTCLAVFRGLN